MCRHSSADQLHVHSSVGASRWERDAPLIWSCEYLEMMRLAGLTRQENRAVTEPGVNTPHSRGDATAGGNEKESLFTSEHKLDLTGGLNSIQDAGREFFTGFLLSIT